jgi:YVTN family beta-propeller protein
MVAATINVPDSPTSVCYCPVNDRIYVTCRNGGDVVVIDPATNLIESNIGGSPSSFNRPFSITYSPATRLLYVVEDYAPGSPTVGYILSIDPVTNEIVSRTSIGQGYCSLLFIPGVNKLYSGRFAPYGGSPDAEVQVLSI